MDYQRMMMETPVETMRRFERKRKLKEVLCRFGLIAHKIQLGDTTHFAFALATPAGTPIARPCSSEDLAECSQWLASKYPTHLFLQGTERPAFCEFEGSEARSDARYKTADLSDSKDLMKNVREQLAPSSDNTNLFPGTDLRSTYRMCGTMGDLHASLAVEPPLRYLQPSELLGTVDQPVDSKHCSTDSHHVVKRSTCRSRNWSEVEKTREKFDRNSENRSGAHGHEQLKRSRQIGHHEERGSAHGEHKERGSAHVEHLNLTDRKDRSIIKCHHKARDSLRVRRKTRRVGARTSQNEPLKSDEGSGICGQNLPSSTSGLTKNKLDSTSRMVVRMLNVANWDCLFQGGPSEVGLSSRGDKIMLESDAESRPQELSTLLRTVSGIRPRIGSSDVSLPPEHYDSKCFAISRFHANELRWHSRKDASFDCRHAPHAIQRTDFQECTQSHPHDHLEKDGNLDSGDDRGAIPEYELIIASEDLVHPSLKAEKPLAWKPSPLYQVTGPRAPEKSETSSDTVYTSDNDLTYDDEACEKEERAVIRYLRLFADDKSWKEGFESAAWLTCDVCNLGGRTNRVPDVKALVSHATTMKRIKMAEHRGYARAICKLMNFDSAATNRGNKGSSMAGENPAVDAIVWPPVLVLENTRTVKDQDGLWKGVDATEITEVLKVALSHKESHTFRPIRGKNGHKGRVLVEFTPSRQSWGNANTVHKQFQMNARGYTEWLRVKPRGRRLGPSSMNDSFAFVCLDDTGNPKPLLYGYLAEPRHMEVFDPARKYVKNWKIVSKNILKQL